VPDCPATPHLEIGAGEPCLLLRCTTWSGGMGVTQAALTYPGSRCRLHGRFVPRLSAGVMEWPADRHWADHQGFVIDRATTGRSVRRRNNRSTLTCT
jgi:hypothetical protein